MPRTRLLAAAVLAAASLLGGCAHYTIEPGHRGLMFDPGMGGLQHEVLQPGLYKLPGSGHVDDYDVTYTTHDERVAGLSREGLPIDVRFAVVTRPIISELYQLDAEIGPAYYDEVVGPEARSAARGILATTSITELTRPEKIEDAIEAELRLRTRGKHVEIASVALQATKLPVAVEDAMRERVRLEEQTAAVKQKMLLDEARKAAELRVSAEAQRHALDLAATRGDLAKACGDASDAAAGALLEHLAKLSGGDGARVSLELLDADRDAATGDVRMRARATLRSSSRGEIAVTEVSCHESGSGADARCMAGLERDISSWLDGVGR